MKRVLAPLLNETANRLDCSYICYVGPKTMATQFTDTKIAIEHLLNSISVQPNTIVFISDSASFSEGSNNEPIQQKMMIDLIHAGKRDDFLRQVEANVNARLGDMFDIKTAYHMFVDYRQMFHVALFEYDIAASSAFSNPHLFTKMDVIHSKQAFLSAVTVQLDIVLSAIDAKRKAESLLGQIQSYVQEHLTSDLSREEIAQHFFVHPDYLSHFFHRNAGITLAAYIRKIRIQEAMRLLDATNLSISEISFQVGYSNPSYFTRAFFRELGITPREYRHRNDSPIAARK